ncbi:HEXXH motif domain-containing protein [Frankia sp. R82]|uniref:HEXXH motif domain-containing protein n=1 Tax=Frankia sp. R82 TaxID=2950553 RepID=UPI002042D647|nr:HEXXH motif domain-containing protein [Frankia sp. R82]MCM3882066.1 HEXXH motif domain-containing protein [Frankia sp. R82]
MRWHRLPGAAFDELAHGGGGPEIVRMLWATQLSRRLLVLRALMDDTAQRAPALLARSDVAHSYAVLAQAQQRSQAVVDALLLSPGVGLWSMHCLRRLRGSVSASVPLEEDLAGLGALAAVAALRSGVTAEVTVVLRDGGLYLPGCGLITATFSGWARASMTDGVMRLSAAPGVAIIQTDASSTVPLPAGRPGSEPAPGVTPLPAAIASVVMVPDGTAPDATGPDDVGADGAGPAGSGLVTTGIPDGPRVGFIPVRRLVAGAGTAQLAIVLDDLDPARLMLDLPVASSGAGEPAELWQQRLTEGWRLLSEADPQRAMAIGSGMAAIFPLRPTDREAELSASSGEAFGGPAMTLPKDGFSFAAALVHEFQHSKLSALLDLVDLFDSGSSRLFYAPWRSDPRPLSGLLQGAYAFLGLVGLWDSCRRLDAGSNHAHFEFARWREEVWRVVVEVRASGELTPLGRRFVAGMQSAAAAYRRTTVPAVPLRLAHQVIADTRLLWRLRNLEPAPEQVDRLAQAWVDGTAVPDLMIRTTTVPAARGLVHNTRLALIHRRLADPTGFKATGMNGVESGAAEMGGSLDDRHVDPAVSPADLAFGFDQLDVAAHAYKKEIAQNPDHLDAWAGLVLCLRDVPSAAGRRLLERPELVRAVYHGIENLTGTRVDPEALAAWLPVPRGSVGRVP